MRRQRGMMLRGGCAVVFLLLLTFSAWFVALKALFVGEYESAKFGFWFGCLWGGILLGQLYVTGALK